MAKTISVAQLGHGGASRAIREAQQEPVLVSKENRPVAWIISAEEMAQAAAALGEESAAVYRKALQLLAVQLYRDSVLSLGNGARLAGMSIHDFIDLCGRIRVPVLWEPPGADADRLKGFLDAELEAARAIADRLPPQS